MKLKFQANRDLYYEVGAILFCLLVLVWMMSPLLIVGMTALRHDNFYNYYPAFQFVADSLLNGHLPLWNPYTHGGEPFYPILVQERLLEPLTLLTIWIGHYFTPDFVLLCNWNRFIQSAVMVFGVYLVLRPIAQYLFIRLSLLPILFFSSFFLGSFHQEGILHQFLWVPYLTIFLQRILVMGDQRWFNWIALTLSVGINFQTYFFAGPALFLLVYLSSIFIFKRELVSRFLGHPSVYRKLGMMGLMLGLMALPNIMLYLDSKDLVFPMRMYSQEQMDIQKVSGEPGPMQYEGKPTDVLPAIKMPYELVVATGSYATLSNYLQLLFPRGNGSIHGSYQAWGNTSESYLYLGLLTWIIALFGVFCGKGELKKPWLVLLGTFFLLSLGATGLLHRILYSFFPLIWGMRNCHCLVLFVEFAILYFYVLGLNRLSLYWQESRLEALKIESSVAIQLQHAQAKWRRLLWDRRRTWVSAVCLLLVSWLCTEVLLRLSLLTLPSSLWIGPVLFGLAFIIFLLRKTLGKGGMLCALLGGQIALVFYWAPNKSWFLNYFLFFAGIPFLWLVARELYPSLQLPRKRESVLYSALFLCWLVGDLVLALGYSWPLYRGQPHPAKYLNVQTEKMTPVFPEYRAPHEFYPLADIVADPPLEQIPRYLSILFRKPYALSARFIRKHKDSTNFTEALEGKRWNSFVELKNYFHLLNMGIQPAVLEEMFAIRAPAFQFKENALVWGSDSHTEFLKRLNGPSGVQLLKRNIILSGAETSLENLRSVPVRGSLKYEIEDYGVNSVKAKIVAPATGYLYWADGYDRHWKGLLDGKPIGVLRANFNFKAIAVSPGPHSLEFIYDPVEFKMSLFLFYAVIVMGLAFLAGLIIRDKLVVTFFRHTSGPLALQELS